MANVYPFKDLPLIQMIRFCLNSSLGFKPFFIQLSIIDFFFLTAPEAPKINVSRSSVTSLDSRDPITVRVGQKLDVLSGTKVSIECPVSGIPEPVVNWKRQDGPLLAEDSVLTLGRVTMQSTGVYVCRAFNLAGDVMARSIVNVTGKCNC